MPRRYDSRRPSRAPRADLTPTQQKAALINEADLQHIVMSLLKLTGWSAYHTWASIHSAAGFPDIIATKGPRLVAAELKSEKGEPTLAQAAWLERLGAAGAETYVWKPSHWLAGSIEAVLRGKEAP